MDRECRERLRRRNTRALYTVLEGVIEEEKAEWERIGQRRTRRISAKKEGEDSKQCGKESEGAREDAKRKRVRKSSRRIKSNMKTEDYQGGKEGEEASREGGEGAE